MRGRALTSPEGPGAARCLFIVLAAAAFCLSRRLRGRGGREGGRTDSRTERTEPLRQRRCGGGGRRERAGGGAARGPLTRFRLSAARARAASARVTPERKRDSPGAAARERPWPTRTSSSTSSSETQVGEPGPARAGAGRRAERKARLPAPISAVLAVPPTWWLRARKRRCLPPASAPGPARGLGLVSRWPWAAGSRLRARLEGRGAARAVSPPWLRRQSGAAEREKALSQRNLHLGNAQICSVVAARPHSTPQFCDEFLSHCCELRSAQAAWMLFPVSAGAAVANSVKTRCQRGIKRPGYSSLI